MFMFVSNSMSIEYIFNIKFALKNFCIKIFIITRYSFVNILILEESIS